MSIIKRLFGCLDVPNAGNAANRPKQQDVWPQPALAQTSSLSSADVDAVVQVPATASLLLRSASGHADKGEPDSLSELVSIMGVLTHAHGTVLGRLKNAAASIQDRLGASITSVTVVSMNGDGPTQTCIVACGPDSHVCRVGLPQPVPCSQYPDLRTQGVQVVANMAQAKATSPNKSLPPCWLDLHAQCGHCSFAAVPICCRGQQVAVLTLVYEQECKRLRDASFLLQLKGLGHWMAKYFEGDELASLCHILESVTSADKIDLLVKIIAGGLTDLAAKKHHVQTSCRVALMGKDGMHAAMVFEENSPSSRGVSQSAASDDSVHHQPRQKRRSSGCYSSLLAGAHDGSLRGGSVHGGQCYGAHSYGEPTGHPLNLDRTVLGDVVRDGGRVVADTTAWFQNPACPSRDMFVSPRGNKVHSMVVAVCRHAGSPLMGIYLTSPSPVCASLLKVLLLDLEEWLGVLTPLLHQKLQEGDLAEDYQEINGILDQTKHGHAIDSRTNSPTPVRRTDTPESVPRYSDLDSIRRSADSDSPPASIGPGSAAAKALAAHKLHKTPGREPSFTVFQGAGGPQRMLSPMILGLQDRLRMLQIASVQEHAGDRPSDLKGVELMEVIGAGGFGTVYHGWCDGTEVAIKVVLERAGDREVLRDALELAVLSTLSHPNILQVLTYFTNVVVVGPSHPTPQVSEVIEIPGIGLVKRPPAQSPLGSLTGATAQQVRLIPADEAKEGEGQRALAICMEYCDCGSLADAIARGEFQVQVDKGCGALKPDMNAVLHILLEVAHALKHLHSLQLVHCDVKPSNVLLRAVNDNRRFTAKLSDFGLAKMVVNGCTTQPDQPSSMGTQAAELHQHIQQLMQQQQHSHYPQQPQQQQQQQQQQQEEGGIVYQLGPTPSRISGTITHMAPEVLANSACVDCPADIYAFGIMMWELLLSDTPYGGMAAATIRQKVVTENMRPMFWRWVEGNNQYIQLAQKCWAPDPLERPTAEALVMQLIVLKGKYGTEPGSKRRHSSYTPQTGMQGVALPALQQQGAAPLIRLSRGNSGGKMQRSRSYCARTSDGEKEFSGNSFPMHIL